MTNSTLIALVATPAKAARTVKPVTPPKARVLLTARTIRAVIVFSNTKRNIKRLEERKTRMEAVIRAGLGEAEVGTNAEGLAVVQIMHSSNGKFDAAILRKLAPVAAKKAFVSTPYTYIKVI